MKYIEIIPRNSVLNMSYLNASVITYRNLINERANNDSLKENSASVIRDFMTASSTSIKLYATIILRVTYPRPWGRTGLPILKCVSDHSGS